MASRERIGSSGTRVLSSVILVLGVVIVVRTAVAGGGPLSVGVLIGVIFMAIGVARLYLSARTAR
jgi:hypothetical protein